MVSSAAVPRIQLSLVVVAFVSIGSLGTAQPAPPQQKPVNTGPDTWYTEVLLAGGSEPAIEHLWSKGPWLRSELVVRGQPILQLVKGDRYVIINRIERSGIAIRRKPEAIALDAHSKRPFADDRDRIVAAGGERVGTDTLGGRECEVYRVTDGDGRRETCVTSGGLPVRTKMWHRSSGQTTTATYLSWATEVPLPDSFFEAEPGVTLEEYGYEQYLVEAQKGPIGPAPALHSYLLHGR
jgi:hypothetical protein